MSKYIIVADSCMDLNKEQREEYGVERPIPGGVVYPDGSDHLADIDWETITFEEFYHVYIHLKPQTKLIIDR